ncbi:MAG: protein-disulfide reductase DsbD domain-containing protein [Litoreibacter sp.]
MKNFLLSLALTVSTLSPGFAASSFDHTAQMLNARLITAEDGINPTATTISAGLVIDLNEGWHSYWKSPGQVGYPPTVDWSASENVASVDFQWPAPKRFIAFGIENYGYEGLLTHPLMVTLKTPGEAVKLRGTVSLLVCADICVPQDFDLAVSVGKGGGIDATSAITIAQAAEKVPAKDNADLKITSVSMTPSKDALNIAFEGTTPLKAPIAFVDMGPEASFGTPETTLMGQTGSITLPVLSLPATLPVPEITLTDGTLASVTTIELGTATAAATSGLLWTLVLAFIGGLILNVMPCVLPVLSIKFASALKSADQSITRIRAGFIVSALGVLAFMWALAAILITLRATGGQVGWGLQFQSPLFLSVMVAIMVLFAANLAGFFEITLPQSWTTKMARADGQPGLVGDFATGALAAVMATPCSAPFLGTAVTVALAGSNLDTISIFTALGAGLALPYLLVAAKPSLVQRLPKPGAWMNVVKLVLAGLMAATALWLGSVLHSIIGNIGIGLLAVALLITILGVSQARNMFRAGGLAIGLAAILIAPSFTAAPVIAVTDETWMPFDEAEIASYVADGQIVFVDVTAAWCLTCKANKSLVLEREAVQTRLNAENTMAMVADWTRPDPTILAYLQKNDRFGIPFNIIYGPGAPEGIPLPEILTQDAVLQAFAQAEG